RITCTEHRHTAALAHFFPGCAIPNANRAIVTAGSQILAIAREGQGGDHIRMPLQANVFFARRHIPQPNFGIAAARGQRLAVRRESEGKGPAFFLKSAGEKLAATPRGSSRGLVARKPADLLAGGGVPEPHVRVPFTYSTCDPIVGWIGGSQQLAVRRIGDARRPARPARRAKASHSAGRQGIAINVSACLTVLLIFLGGRLGRIIRLGSDEIVQKQTTKRKDAYRGQNANEQLYFGH